MKIGYIFLFGLLAACNIRATNVMTGENFSKTHVGSSEESLIKTYGQPLSVYHKDNGETVYEYVERFQMGGPDNRIVEARKYYFTIKDKKIVHKQMVLSNQPGYDSMNDLPGN